jgi:SAM-dependent methyltransferase
VTIQGGEDRLAPERHARYRWAAELTAGGRVLDAGCGIGWGTVLLAESATAVGVDFSPPAIAEARREHGDRARFVEGDLRSLPLDDDDFDCVVCFETLAHVSEPVRVLDELCRVLRPGGMLIVSSPNPAVYPAGNPLHLSETMPEELTHLLRARFANVAVHGQQTYFAALLGDTELLAHDDPAVEISVRVTKLTGGSLGSELHAVAVATDGELPAKAPAWLVLDQDVDYEERQQPLREWQERAVRAEAEACALKRKLRESQS